MEECTITLKPDAAYNLIHTVLFGCLALSTMRYNSFLLLLEIFIDNWACFYKSAKYADHELIRSWNYFFSLVCFCLYAVAFPKILPERFESLGSEMLSRAPDEVQSQSFTQIFQGPENPRTQCSECSYYNCFQHGLAVLHMISKSLSVFFQNEVPLDIPHVCICIFWPVQYRSMETYPEVYSSLHITKG